MSLVVFGPIVIRGVQINSLHRDSCANVKLADDLLIFQNSWYSYIQIHSEGIIRVKNINKLTAIKTCPNSHARYFQ